MKIGKKLLLLALLLSPLTSVHSFPDKPVRIIVPFPPGGGVDVLIRAVAAELTAKWDAPVIVENKPGAGSVIGASYVAKADPDGHTLLATINQTLTSNRFLYKNLTYQPDDFVPVTLLTRSDQLLLASQNVHAKDLKGLQNEVKAGKSFTFGSFGAGSQPHLLYSLLQTEMNADMVHVPYKGVSPALTAVVSGEVDLTTSSANVAGAMLNAGKIRALAVAGPTRSSMFPDVPTTVEQGYPNLQAAVLYVLVAPPNTPDDIASGIAADVIEIMQRPEFVQKHATSRGLDVVAGGPQVLKKALHDDTEMSRRMVEAAGVTPE